MIVIVTMMMSCSTVARACQGSMPLTCGAESCRRRVCSGNVAALSSANVTRTPLLRLDSDLAIEMHAELGLGYIYGMQIVRRALARCL